MEDLEVCKNRFMYYSRGEGWANVEASPFIMGRSLVLQCLVPLIHLLEIPLYIGISGIVGLKILR